METKKVLGLSIVVWKGGGMEVDSHSTEEEHTRAVEYAKSEGGHFADMFVITNKEEKNDGN